MRLDELDATGVSSCTVAPGSCIPGNRPPSIANAACYFGVIKLRRTRDSCPNQIAKAHA
jgi:hypothetical protein